MSDTWTDPSSGMVIAAGQSYQLKSKGPVKVRGVSDDEAGSALIEVVLPDARSIRLHPRAWDWELFVPEPEVGKLYMDAAGDLRWRVDVDGQGQCWAETHDGPATNIDGFMTRPLVEFAPVQR